MYARLVVTCLGCFLLGGFTAKCWADEINITAYALDGKQAQDATLKKEERFEFIVRVHRRPDDFDIELSPRDRGADLIANSSSLIAGPLTSQDGVVRGFHVPATGQPVVLVFARVNSPDDPTAVTEIALSEDGNRRHELHVVVPQLTARAPMPAQPDCSRPYYGISRCCNTRLSDCRQHQRRRKWCFSH